MSPPVDEQAPGALVALVLEEEGRRHAEQESRAGHLDMQGGQLPRDRTPWGAGLHEGGLSSTVVLCAGPFLGGATAAVVVARGAELSSDLGLGTGRIGVLAGFTGLLLGVSALLFGWLGDRRRRPRVISGCAALSALFVFFAGGAMSGSALTSGLALVALLAGNELPAQGSLLADRYPLGARGRVFGLVRASQGLGLVVGAVAAWIAGKAVGSDDWRALLLGIAVLWAMVAVAAWRLQDERRGAAEARALALQEGSAHTDDDAAPVRAALARLRKVRSFGLLTTGAAACGYWLVAVVVLDGGFLQHKYHLSAGERGQVLAWIGVGIAVGACIGGAVVDALQTRSLLRAAQGASGLLAVAGVLGAVGFVMPDAALYTVFAALAAGAAAGAWAGVLALTATVVPPRYRSTGFASLAVYFSLAGGVGGALLVRWIEPHWSLGDGLLTVGLAVGVLGGSVLAYGGTFLAADAALATSAIAEDWTRDAVPADGPRLALEVRNLDFSYGPVQVLFDVSVDVQEGEVLALLGTNGAGKSTLLRAISGLSPVDRGVVRFHGRSITYDDPGDRLAAGIVQVPGGKATFPSLTVLDNLRSRAFRVNNKEIERRLPAVFETFPMLEQRKRQLAGTLSGGEQQMLAIAGAMMLEPKLLLVDELSLGLAPVVVQQLLEVVARLKEQGLTMVIVEQSVNVALTLADRAVFMEKGQVRFQGPAQELLERDDLVRAVFLGGSGG